jgi:hypothetical protein
VISLLATGGLSRVTPDQRGELQVLATGHWPLATGSESLIDTGLPVQDRRNPCITYVISLPHSITLNLAA